MKILTVIGARPQFVKAAVLSKELAERPGVREVLVHTGQHYDFEMSQIFFDQLGLREPDYELSVGSGPHGAQTGEMLKSLEPIMVNERPDWVLVYGDTNSTLAGALAAAKLHIPVAHVEAGLRSFDRSMPEEINRVVADHLADMHFVPNSRAAELLAGEGIRARVEVVGDLMVDLAKKMAAMLPVRPAVLDRFGLVSGEYAVATVHRASNTDDPAAFDRIVAAFRALDLPVVFPVHPRTASLAKSRGVGSGDNIVVSEPLSYADMIALQLHARSVLTDSGGMQKEAYVLAVPCVTLRGETEWTETLEDGWNVLAGNDEVQIARAAVRPKPRTRPKDHYGDGSTAARIADALGIKRAAVKNAAVGS